ALTSDVEQARTERQRHAEARRDERGGVGERLGERADRQGEAVRLEVHDGTAEQRRVRAADGLAERDEGVAGPCEEVGRGRLHLLVGEGDHDRPGDDREQHGARRHGPRAAHRLLQGLGQPARRVDGVVPDGRAGHAGPLLLQLLGRAGVELRLLGGVAPLTRLGRAHATSPFASCGEIPAIMRPSTSRGVSPGTMPTTLPRYITMIRSASATASSSSVETTTTGTPASRVATIRLWMNSIEPTSTPRVGCAATSRRRSRDISRATTTFCWLPPERRPTGVVMPWVRTSYSCT